MSPRWLDCSSGKIPDDLATHVGQIMHLPPSPRAARGDFLFMFSIISIIIPSSSACFGRSQVLTFARIRPIGDTNTRPIKPSRRWYRVSLVGPSLFCG
jgi:hypothetical protein